MTHQKLPLCLQPLKSKSKYANITPKKCHLPKNHVGRCSEFPFLEHLNKVHKSVAQKIKRDSTMTTGASWNSEEAGPNRIVRWAMLLDDETLLTYGLDMSKLKPGVVGKLRDKAADYDSCIKVAMKLAWLVYGMKNAPEPDPSTKAYLEFQFGKIEKEATCCIICKKQLDFNLFKLAKRGNARLETCHSNPRKHNADNLGLGHRECNIAQGNRTLEEFYSWIEGIMERRK